MAGSGGSGLARFQAEILLFLSLLLPLAFPSGAGLGSLLSSAISPLLPEADAAPSEGEDPFRDEYFRLLVENADLRARLLALGEAARLVAFDEGFWSRNPLRIEAAVIAHDASPWRGSLVISAGADAGIREGAAVIVGNALLGTIGEVGPGASRVRLLTDAGQRIWAAVVTGSEQLEGFVAGAGVDGLDMMLVRAAPGAAGAPVITAGGSEIVPRGLLVGRVDAFDDIDRNGVAEVTVSPALDPAEVRFVNVLTFE